MRTEISRITLYVNDQQAAKDFWIKKMGFHCLLEQPMQEHTWLEVAPQKEGTRFVLYEKALMQKQNPQVSVQHPSLILSTCCIDQTYATLKANGVDIQPIMNFPYGRMCNFKDQDGNMYMLREDSAK